MATATLDWWRSPRHVLAFEAAALSPHKRLIVEAAVRHGKSAFFSFVLPAWRALTQPHSQHLIIGHGEDFAAEFLGHSRRLFARHAYNLGVSIATRERNTQDVLTLSNGSTIRAAGVGSGIAGRGFHSITIDDCYRDQAEAESAQNRGNVERWFHAEALTRREPGCRVAVVLSRRHPEDLSGTLLKSNDDLPAADKWQSLKFPAIDGNGEALWPQRFPLSVLTQIREEYASKGLEYLFAGLFQQNPRSSPDTIEWPDDYFTDDIWYDELPPNLPVRYTIVATDPSKGSQSKGGDYCAIATMKLDSRGTIWIEDTWMKPSTIVEVTAMEAAIILRDRPVAAIQETGGFQESLAIEVRRLLDEAGCRVPIYPYDSMENKKVRIRIGLTGWLHQHRLRFRKTHGNRIAVGQYRSFPGGQHDDAPDCHNMGIALLDQLCG